MMSLLCPNELLPELTLTTQACLRSLYGLCLLSFLFLAFRHGRRFFQSERWGGYAESSTSVDLIQNPFAYRILLVIWFSAALSLTLGLETILSSLVNMVLCYYFFIWMRWRGVLRGMGAPGFMTWWLAAAIFFLEWTTRFARESRSWAVLVFQLDYAFIMLSAGLYKLTAGYAKNNGMELGMVNPMWGYAHRFWRRFRPSHPIYFTLNQLAWGTEVVAAILMMIPATRLIGGLLMIGSFIFIATTIRLGVLCQMVMLGGMFFFCQGTIAQQIVDSLAIWRPSGIGFIETIPGWMVAIIPILLWTYLCLLPLAHAGLFYNFYRQKRLYKPIQRALEWYTNLFGIIIWRVFSADHTNFYIRIYRQSRTDDNDREYLSTYDQFGSRFNHVGECITVTSVFTTLKYYPSDSEIFTKRILRYARTLNCPQESVIVMEYVSIRKTDDQFEDYTVAEFVIDLESNQVTEQTLNQEIDIRSGNAGSPLHAGSRPGSYVA